MLNSILLSAALLLGGPSVSAREMMVEAQATVAPVEETASYISDATITILIQSYAAPHWNLTIAEAWRLYNAKMMKITEITPNYHYVIEYDGGILDVLMDNENY